MYLLFDDIHVDDILFSQLVATNPLTDLDNIVDAKTLTQMSTYPVEGQTNTYVRTNRQTEKRKLHTPRHTRISGIKHQQDKVYLNSHPTTMTIYLPERSPIDLI